jgi:hypothetical protein
VGYPYKLRMQSTILSYSLPCEVEKLEAVSD